ncbi:hypothetical protein Tco_1314187 [Tanacetum coccineum]
MGIDSVDDGLWSKPKEATKTVKPSFEKIESVNARNETVRQAENLRKNNKNPKGNKRNWNEFKDLSSTEEIFYGDLENLKTTYLIMKKVWVRMHPNRGGIMMQMQRLPSLMRLQMMLETRTTRFQTAIRSEEVFGYILLVIKKLTFKKLDD